jgi:hypothetical protein
MVIKSLSWALCALSMYEPNAVLAFLDEFKETLAPRISREVMSKLKTGRKFSRRSSST